MSGKIITVCLKFGKGEFCCIAVLGGGLTATPLYGISMKAKLISTSGKYLEAIIEIEGQKYCVMDNITVFENKKISVGDKFDCELSAFTLNDESWESLFSSNRVRKKGLEQIDGWQYRAYGKIMAINPVKVDCGLLVVEDVIFTNDKNVIGEYIAFTISRLDCNAI